MLTVESHRSPPYGPESMHKFLDQRRQYNGHMVAQDARIASRIELLGLF